MGGVGVIRHWFVGVAWVLRAGYKERLRPWVFSLRLLRSCYVFPEECKYVLGISYVLPGE